VSGGATPEARLDVARNLRLRPDHLDLRTSVDRPNLCYRVLPKPPGAGARGALLRAVAADSARGIVYVPTTREVDEVHAELAARGVASRPYHAKLAVAERAESHARFSAGEVRVMVVTLAFGMGIDQPDVRRVFHWGPPKSVEAYYQQSGRAGRDGQPADCVMWVLPGDWCKVERIAVSDSSQPDRDRRSVRALRDYCESTGCRRQRLAAYFGEPTGQRHSSNRSSERSNSERSNSERSKSSGFVANAPIT
jgi:ATP-dependent DNA helicase RecQ